MIHRRKLGLAVLLTSAAVVAAFVGYRPLFDKLPDWFPTIPLDTGPHGWPAPGGGAAQIAAGGAASCARMRSGEVWCWGALGLEPHPEKIRTTRGDIQGWPRRIASGIESVSLGRVLRCASRADHVLRCWARRDSTAASALGDLVIPNVRDVAMGGEHACALQSDGIWVCWGENRRGQLGDGTRAPRASPAPVPDLRDATSMALGAAHSCALTTTGHVLCWGANDLGQLGDGTTNERSTPMPVADIDDAVQIAAGAMHTCARSRRGEVRCWGLGRSDAAPDAPPAPRPVLVPAITDATSLTAAQRESCALRASGRVYCWHDLDGEPRRVRNLSDVIAIAAGDDHTCALRKDGNVACWGSNTGGQLGVDLGARREDNVERAITSTDIAVDVRWTAPGPVTSPAVSASPW